MCISNKSSHLLTKSAVWGRIYEELDAGHRSAIFEASTLSNQIIRDVKKQNLHISIENGYIIIYW